MSNPVMNGDKDIRFKLNGRDVGCKIYKGELLLNTLRERFSLLSVKEGCGIGECGTCTVLIDDEPCYSCLTLTEKIEGRDVKTVEFLESNGVLHPLQEAFIRFGAVQCGYCTPGMLLSAYSLLKKKKNPTRDEIKKAISGNLCRCTGYVQIVEAVHSEARKGISNLKSQISNLREERPHIRKKDDVLKILSGHKGTKIIAGGTDLIVKSKNGDNQNNFIDITLIPGITKITKNDGNIIIGAASTHAQISNNIEIKRDAGCLSYACSQIGTPQIRNMGTIGGNLVNASPAADTLPPLLVHDAVLTLESTGRKRAVSLDDFIVAPYKTLIEDDELLTSISIKRLKGYQEGYKRVTKRATWAISRLSVAWAILKEADTYKDVRIAIGSCTPIPFRAKNLEDSLKGEKADDNIIRESIKMMIEEIKAVSGIRPSFAYKLPVIEGILTEVLNGRT